MDLTEFGVSLEALEAAAKGIDDAVAALADIGVKQTADAGRGVELLAVSRADMGHDGLASALGEFCDRWEWGVRSLVREGMAIRQSLLDTRDAYQRVEDTVGGSSSVWCRTYAVIRWRTRTRRRASRGDSSTRS
ncbi:hypothetical protein C3Y87_19395 [Carbonactinospora thermoautotrophica]|uniref:hypothetical protein n=1 Tax=Carbonactinospora thermoautotrophica TaxID=1469144 RepID=UPI00226FAE61|nr:hypothetical protein [Carbonactinospora thermoautotrophica]MCX9193516.1 hypothetical protein [Carbonactinospora thermoautotrophica]